MRSLKFVFLLGLLIASCAAPELEQDSFKNFIEQLEPVKDSQFIEDAITSKCDCVWSGSHEGISYTIVGVGNDYYISTGGGVWTSVTTMEIFIYNL